MNKTYFCRATEKKIEIFRSQVEELMTENDDKKKQTEPKIEFGARLKIIFYFDELSEEEELIERFEHKKFQSIDFILDSKIKERKKFVEKNEIVEIIV